MGPWGSGIVVAAIAALCIVVLWQDAGQPVPAAEAPPSYVPDAKKGEQWFRREAMCLTCHQLDGRGAFNAPPLDHVATKFTELKGGREKAREFFRNHLLEPEKYPGTEKEKYTFVTMPSFHRMGMEKIQDICEYLLTLQ